MKGLACEVCEGDEVEGAGVMLMAFRALAASAEGFFWVDVESEAVCAASLLDDASLPSDGAGDAEGGGPPSFANRLARI